MDTKNNYNASVVGDMGNWSVLFSSSSVVASADLPDRGVQLIDSSHVGYDNFG
jgi:hypothetical protein